MTRTPGTRAASAALALGTSRVRCWSRQARAAGRQGGLLVSAGQGGGQDSLDRAQLPGQGQFAEGFAVLQAVCGDLVAGHQQAEGDGQVEAAAFLGQISWGEVDGDALEAGKVEVGVLQRAADPILALTYCGLDRKSVV